MLFHGTLDKSPIAERISSNLFSQNTRREKRCFHLQRPAATINNSGRLCNGSNKYTNWG